MNPGFYLCRLCKICATGSLQTLPTLHNSARAEQKVEDLQKRLSLKAKMIFKQPFYYQEVDNVPFCPRCFEKDTQAAHVILEHQGDTRTRWDCPECKRMYLIESGVRQRHQAPPYGGGPGVDGERHKVKMFKRVAYHNLYTRQQEASNLHYKHI